MKIVTSKMKKNDMKQQPDLTKYDSRNWKINSLFIIIQTVIQKTNKITLV